MKMNQKMVEGSAVKWLLMEEKRQTHSHPALYDDC